MINMKIVMISVPHWFYFITLLIALQGHQVAYAQAPDTDLTIRADFPGGNMVIEKMTSDTVWIVPDTRGIVGDWFYWYFSAEAAVDREIHFVFPEHKIPTFGPAVSLDGGATWNWMFDEQHSGMSSFSYQFRADQEVRFSMGFPYTKANFDRFIAAHRSDPAVRLDTLCVSKSGHVVPVLYINKSAKRDKKKIVITARHHACEMMANYALEGFIAALLANGTSDWLNDNFEFMIVPFVDMDGVEGGHQGKNRYPRDHNRDYSDESIYETTSAIRRLLPQWAGDDLAVALDLHCPGLVGSGHELLHLVGSKKESIARQEEKFAGILAQNLTTGLTFGPTGLLPFGESWNVATSEQLGASFRSWVQNEFEQVKLAATVEIPYANNEGQQVSKDNLSLLGADLVKSLEIYLKK